MRPPARDLAYLEAGLPALEPYLLSEQLFWRLNAPAGLPFLTIGGLLLALKRVSAAPMEADTVQTLTFELERLRRRWAAAWERKCRQELHARLAQWKNGLEEVRQSADEPQALFMQQVQWRLLVSLLSHEVADPPTKELRQLEELDARLRAIWKPAKFIFDAPLAGVFPQDEFWYLYGQVV